MPLPVVVVMTDSSQIGEGRRTALRLADEARLPELEKGRVAIIATELGTNLLRHAIGGRLVIQVVETANCAIVEILAIDNGPGIANPELALQDGYSTAGTAGQGLGAVRRLATAFDMYSQREKGTVILARVAGPACPDVMFERAVWSGISIPAPHETECGDGWKLYDEQGHFALIVADGLGHGPEAAKASERAIEVFQASPQMLPADIMHRGNQGLHGTRGAAIAIAALMKGESTLRYAGIGNIAGTVFSDLKSQGLVSHNGTVGVQVRKIQEFTYPVQANSLLIMHSDGLQTRWNFTDYPGLINRHPAIIAGVLYRDFLRGRDDMTVVVVRIGPQGKSTQSAI